MPAVDGGAGGSFGLLDTRANKNVAMAIPQVPRAPTNYSGSRNSDNLKGVT